jgi:hypothetical protein
MHFFTAGLVCPPVYHSFIFILRVVVPEPDRFKTHSSSATVSPGPASFNGILSETKEIRAGLDFFVTFQKESFKLGEIYLVPKT